MRGEYVPSASDTSPERAGVIGFNHYNKCRSSPRVCNRYGGIRYARKLIPNTLGEILIDSMVYFRHRLNIYRLPLFRVEATSYKFAPVSLSPSADCSTAFG